MGVNNKYKRLLCNNVSIQQIIQVYLTSLIIEVQMLQRSRSMLKSKLFVLHSEVYVILISSFLDYLKFIPKTSNAQIFVLIQHSILFH